MHAVRTLGLVLASFNVMLCFCVPALRAGFDQFRATPPPPGNPIIGYGAQELLTYVDPWLSQILHVVYTAGLAAIPFFLTTREPPPRGSRLTWTMVLLCLEVVWLFLIAMAVCFRGPNWTFYWPSEPYDVHKVVPLNNVNLSDYVWLAWLGADGEAMPWWQREWPGLALVAAYFLGVLIVAKLLGRISGLSCCRSAAGLLIIAVALLVPIKMFLRWSVNLKYVVYVPEYFWNL